MFIDSFLDDNEENEIEEEIIQSTTSTIQKSQPRIYDKVLYYFISNLTCIFVVNR